MLLLEWWLIEKFGVLCMVVCEGMKLLYVCGIIDMMYGKGLFVVSLIL